MCRHTHIIYLNYIKHVKKDKRQKKNQNKIYERARNSVKLTNIQGFSEWAH